MKKKHQTSVIRRMYSGFAVMVVLFATTIVLMLNGTNRIHSQLQSVTTDVLPLVSQANQTSVKLLAADKIFKDFLTSQDAERMQAYEQDFTQAHKAFVEARNQLSEVSATNPALQSQLSELQALEERYFSEAHLAMENYKDQLNAQQERLAAVRRFQQLHTKLSVQMKEYIDEQDNIAVKLMAKSYFIKLKQAETITSDALATDDVDIIAKAVKSNNQSVTHLNYSYRGLSAQLPTLSGIFDESVDQFTRDVGKKGGVLDLHFGYIDAKNRLYTNIATLAKEVDQAMVLLDSFRNEANQVMDKAILSANQAYEQGLTQAIGLGVLVTVLALVIGWRLALAVRRPLLATLKALEQLTAGNMTQRINNNTFKEFDQLNGHINTLADNLQSILRQLAKASGDLAEVATENQATTSEAKNRLNEQRQQTATVATAMTEMEHSVRDVAQGAQNSMEKVHEVETATSTGRDIMSRNITTTHQLSERLDESVAVVAQVQEMSSNIGSILDVIRNIADQTNLLALNAAIEAARAGDQGRGFAVVADEVRVLAKRTTDSTAEIENMIQSLQSSSSQAVSVMQGCVSEMENSITQVSDANGAMEEIQAIIMAISQMSSQIAQAADEQSATSASIARNLEEISGIADSNYTSMEQVAEASDKLDELAHQQNQLVHRFKV